ncbi:unnamed protein product [Urochloa humidicola]
MAPSNKIVTGLFVLLLLASSPTTMLQARMVPSDHARADQALVKESLPSPVGSIATTAPSQDLARDMAPPSGEPEETAIAKGWGTAQVTADGSVPSPGVGH